MTFFFPGAFAFLLTIPAIIVLYLLKQKHTEHTVSSLFLWQEVVRDIEANAPWQRLKKNILMMLEVAAVTLLVFALSNPFMKGIGGDSRNVIVAIDTSISMQSTDIKPSRFDAAKKKASEYISGLKPDTAVTLITMGTDSVIEENISTDRGSLLKKLSSIKATNGAADYDGALDLIEMVSKQNPNTRVALFTDKSLTIPDTANIDFFNMKGRGDNYAVTLLSHTQTKNNITALSRISNYSSRDAIIPVSLYVDGRVFDAKKVDIVGGGIGNVYWTGIPDDALTMECRIDVVDSLDADNAAWNVINPSKTAKVLFAGHKSTFIDKALSLTGGIELYKSNTEDINEMKGYDLYIFNGQLPEDLPEDGNIMIFDPGPNELFKLGEERELPNLKKPKHRFFQHADKFPFFIGKTKILEKPSWAEEILSAEEGAIAFAGQPDNRKLIVFGFDLRYTDFPLTAAFPIAMTESLRWLLPGHIEKVENALPGQSIEFHPGPKTEKVRVITPSGRVFNIPPPFSPGIFTETNETGVYSIEQKSEGAETYHYFCINPPAGETEGLTAAKGGGHTARPVPENTGRGGTGSLGLKNIFLWVALAVLIMEWWVYANGF